MAPKLDSDADWDKEVERAKKEDAQLFQRVKAGKFLWSALGEIAPQFFVICVFVLILLFLLMIPFMWGLLIPIIPIIPIVLPIAIWTYLRLSSRS